MTCRTTLSRIWSLTGAALCVALLGISPVNAQNEDPLSYAKTIAGYDADASQKTVAENFAGLWRVTLVEDGETLSGKAKVADDGGSISLVLNGPDGEEHYRSVEIDAVKFAQDTGPFAASLGVRFEKENAAAPAEANEEPKPPVVLPVERRREAVHFELDDQALDLGVVWADEGRNHLRMRVMTRSDMSKLKGQWSAETRDGLKGGGGASWIRGEPEIAGVIVAEDQLDASAGNNYPYTKDGEPIEHVSRERTLVVFGKNLPEFADEADIRSISAYIQYLPDFRAAGDRDRVVKAAFEKAKVSNTEGYDAFIVTASLGVGVTPGTKDLSVDGARGAWPLVFANQIAVMRFVREGDTASTVFYPGDIGHVRLSFTAYIPIEEIAVSISRGERDKVEDGVLIARRVNDDDPQLFNYMTEPIHFYHREKAFLSPPPDADALRVPVLEGALVNAELVDKAEALTMPPVATATIYNEPSQLGGMWKDALDRVAACNGETIDDYDSYQREEATEISHVILSKLVSRTIERSKRTNSDTSLSSSITLSNGDVAAAVLIRDEFVKLTLATMPRFDQRARDINSVIAYREKAKASERVAAEPFWSVLNATYEKKVWLWDSETEVPLGETLDEAAMAKKFHISEAEAKKWAEQQTQAAAVKQVELMQNAVSTAQDAGDCDVGELLLIAGHRSPQIIASILPRLVKLQEDAGPPKRQYWVPDDAARAYVKGLYITGEAVRALEEYSEADTNVGLAVAAIATMGGAAALEGAGYVGAALWTNAVANAFDLGYGLLGVKNYIDGENYYDFARGASPTLGDAVLADAASKRRSAVMTAVGVLLPAGAEASTLSRLRYFKNVERGRALFHGSENVLEGLSELSEADRAGLAGYYADMLAKVKKSGVGALDEADRAAFETFQNYVERAGVTPPSAAASGDDLVRTAMREPNAADEIDPFAATREEPAPSGDPRLGETVDELPPSGDPRLDETIAEPPPAGDPRLDETITEPPPGGDPRLAETIDEPPPMDPRLDPRGRDIFEVIDDAPIDDSPPLPDVESPAPDFSATPPGSLSDHLSPGEIQELFEPGRNLTPEQIIQKADLIRSGRVPPEMAQGDPRVLEALDEVFGIERERPVFTDNGTIIEPSPNDPRFAETTDFPPPGEASRLDETFTDQPPGLDPRLDETVDVPPPNDPALAETTDFPPPNDPALAETTEFPPPGAADPNATLPPGAVDPNETLPPGAVDPNETLPPGAVDPNATLPPGAVDPNATLPPDYAAHPNGPPPVQFSEAVETSLQRARNEALDDLANYRPGASDRLGLLDGAQKMLESGSPEELAVVDRLHRKMLELGVPEEKALTYEALHFRRPAGPFSQRVNEAQIVSEAVMLYGTRTVRVSELAETTGIAPTAARAVAEHTIERLGYAAGRLEPF